MNQIECIYNKDIFYGLSDIEVAALFIYWTKIPEYNKSEHILLQNKFNFIHYLN